MISASFPFDAQFLGRAVEAPRLARGAWADLFLERARSLRATWDHQGGTRISSGMREGFCLRVVDGGSQKLDAREGLSHEAILDACGRKSGSLPSEAPASSGEADGLDEAGLASFLEAMRERLLSLGLDETQLSVSLEIGLRQTCVCLPGGSLRQSGSSRSIVSCRIGDAGEGLSAGLGASSFAKLVESQPAARLGRELEERVAGRREAREAPEGEFPVLLAAGTGGVFFHEACGHSLEADLVLRGASPFRALLGERVAAPFVSAMDDATQPGLEGSYDFDDEGSPARGIVLIARGVLKAFLADRIHGAILGGGSTGSGRRESYRDSPLPRMSNAFLMAGDEDPEAILRETPHGILVSRLEGGRMDPATGDFRFRASSGRLIESGHLTAPLRPFTLAGNGLVALRAVARVGSDLSFGDGTGSCGKDGQQLPVAAGLPTILISSLAVRPG
ncbi:MAG TPA: TldD/PmbA family protein [Candidatus Polarisedimenticolia bacterium]|nr:TldD/PmbA family protein [Candidatus Polarisedimenticolia bacterium]